MSARSGAAMTDLRVDFDPGDYERKLRQFELFLSDLRSLWPMVVPLAIEWFGRQFQTEGAFGGQAWAPLSASTLAYKAKRFPGRGILYASGSLRQAASRPRRDVGPRHLTLTIESEHGGYHQTGTRKMPARKIVPDRLPMSAQRDLDRAAEEYLDDLVGRLGL